jgi:hypothetical protein
VLDTSRDLPSLQLQLVSALYKGCVCLLALQGHGSYHMFAYGLIGCAMIGVGVHAPVAAYVQRVLRMGCVSPCQAAT